MKLEKGRHDGAPLLGMVVVGSEERPLERMQEAVLYLCQHRGTYNVGVMSDDDIAG